MRSTHCLPSYSFGGHEVFDAIPKFTKLYGKSVAIIGGETALSKALPHIRPVLDKAGIKVLDIIHFGGECTFSRGKEIAQMASVKDADFMFAVGGGKAMDTVKVVALELDDKPFFTIPTIASTCAATSEVAAVYTAEHTFDDVAFVNHPPVHCFIDADILVEAPSRYLWAGMGDTIAKHYETHLSARNREQDYNTQLGLTLASMCSEPILAHGIQAYK
ncbi:MAG: iron-containing alcohol dehydrogenase, partial [Veillonella dispar]|nr:iron-containing alcohol dehydrogenase [Veillonella dispar]